MVLLGTVVVREVGCSDDGHVLGDQQDQSKTYLISHSCGHTAVFSGSAGSHSAVLPCFAFIQFSFLLVLAVPSYTQRWMTH